MVVCVQDADRSILNYMTDSNRRWVAKNPKVTDLDSLTNTTKTNQLKTIEGTNCISCVLYDVCDKFNEGIVG